VPKKEERFAKVSSQGMGAIVVYVDKETGVNYLVVGNGNGVAVTPLLGGDGKPLVAEGYPGEK
jgi:hypothetical protein